MLSGVNVLENQAEYQPRIVAWAHALKTQGQLQPGQRVLMAFSNEADFLLLFRAILAVGAVAVPVNLQWSADDLRYIVGHAAPSLAIVSQQLAEHFAPALPELKTLMPVWLVDDMFLQTAMQETAQNTELISPELDDSDDLALLMYTSGTTGRPKGVMLSQANLKANMAGFHQRIGFTANDTVLLALPLFHCFGLIIGLYALTIGASVVLVSSFTPKALLGALMAQAATSRPVTVLPLVPTMFGLLLDAAQRTGPELFASIRFCISGGAALPLALLERLKQELHLTVLEGYGLSEASPVVAVNTPEIGAVPGSVGLPLDNLELQIVDDARQPLAVGKMGEVRLKGPNVMRGYYRDEAQTQQVLDAQGWLYTGDLGHLDEKGYLYLSAGRKKDLIIKAGENIAPLQIEQVLYQHPSVAEASVIGVPDAKLGEDILACVTLKENQTATEAELRQWCRERLTAYLTPRAIRFYEALPKNGSGKILKTVLREQNQAVSAKPAG